MQRLYGPTEASKLIAERTGRKISVSTIRSWTVIYAPVLSDGAAPPAGGRRELTDRDVDILAEVARLRRQGVPEAVILERMPQIAQDIDEAEPAEASPAATEGADQALQVPAVVQDLVTVLGAIQQDIEANRIEAEEVAQLRSQVQRFEDSDRVKTEELAELRSRISHIEGTNSRYIIAGIAVIIALLLIVLAVVIFT